MKCRVCNEDKLSNEFPSDAITEECNHPVYYCLRCVTKAVRNNWKCPYEKCGRPVEMDSKRLKECEDTLDYLFPEIICEGMDEYEVDPGLDPSQSMIHVTTLTGETESFKFLEMKSIKELKSEIKAKMKVDVDKQRLVYNGEECETYKKDGNDNHLIDCKIKPFATIHLMIVLFSIPETLDRVIFDLSWNYPHHGRDFLDASCLAFTEDVWYTFLDWRTRSHEFMKHSGDRMDDAQKIGHHTIEVELKKVPKCVSHLVFTLSSFRSPTIAPFRNPSLHFYDAANNTQDLCSTSFDHAMNCQMVIICCVSRLKNGNWRIDKGGQLSAGNAEDGYRPAVKTVQQLIQAGHFTGVALEHGETRIRTMNDEESRAFRQRCKNR